MSAKSQPQLGDFPFSVELATRFDDLDVQRHVNNVAVANLYQESRLRFHQEVLREVENGDRDQELTTVLADMHLSYRLETHYPAPVTIGCGATRLGNSSYTLYSAMFQDGKCVGTCETVLVCVKAGKPQPIPPAVRAILSGYQLLEVTR